jgi:eukaryotic-like serine/threonine-protein kinase
MKKSIFVFLVLLTACASSTSAPITATVLSSFTPAPTITLTSTNTPLPTSTNTPLPTMTITPDQNNFVDKKGVSMGFVPAGEFTMGSNNGGGNEQPAHMVYLDSFYMDIYEVTNVLYKTCVNAGGCTSPKKTGSYSILSYYGNLEYNDYPVVYVSWSQANNFCKWRGSNLPTEAQWEKAARSTDGRTYPWGEEIDCLRANSFGCVRVDTTKVGTYESGKSPYGIYDMAGNVQEWVADWFGADYYNNSPASNPLGPNLGQYRVLRGGSSFGDVRSTYRNFSAPSYVQSDIGFRCAKDSP